MGRLADNLTEMVRRLFLLLALVIVVAACTNGSTTTSTDSSGGTVTTTSGSPETTSEIPAGTTTTVAPTWTELPGLDALPQEIQDELLELVRLTEEVRDLNFSEPPTITSVTKAELSARVIPHIEEDAEDFPADEALYTVAAAQSLTQQRVQGLTYVENEGGIPNSDAIAGIKALGGNALSVDESSSLAVHVLNGPISLCEAHPTVLARGPAPWHSGPYRPC